MTDSLALAIATRPGLGRIVHAVLEAFPRHRAFAERHLASCEAAMLDFMEVLSNRALALIGDDLPVHAADYKWMSGLFMKYEMDYRRRKGVEHGDFDAINERFYKNHEQMTRYMHGLMVSQILWRQHAGAAEFFARRFIPMLKPGYDYLEIGPGHGLWLSFAASDPRCASLTGWDVAQSSLAMTKAGLARMGIDRAIALDLRDVCAAPGQTARFDAIVISQVLELVSSPKAAVLHLAAALRRGGLLFVNAPTRLIAPDHIRVWQSDAEVHALLREAGLTIVASDRIAPDAARPADAQGYSAVVIARRG